MFFWSQNIYIYRYLSIITIIICFTWLYIDSCNYVRISLCNCVFLPAHRYTFAGISLEGIYIKFWSLGIEEDSFWLHSPPPRPHTYRENYVWIRRLNKKYSTVKKKKKFASRNIAESHIEEYALFRGKTKRARKSRPKRFERREQSGSKSRVT